MKHLAIVVAVLVMGSLSIAAHASLVPLINDNFESYPIGHQFVKHYNQANTLYTEPIIHTNWYSVSGAMLSGFSQTVIDSGDAGAGKVVDFYDDNATLAAGTAFLYRVTKRVVAQSFNFECDVMLPQDTAGFRIMVNWVQGKYPAGTANGGGQANNGASWAAAIVFEGNVPWATGASSLPGRISYQTESFTPKWVASGGMYMPETWYTVRFEINQPDWGGPNDTYSVKFGPRGGTLDYIAQSVPLIKKISQGSAQVPHVNAVSFSSSDKSTTQGETAGHMYIDRVTVQGEQPVNPDPDNLPAGVLNPTNMNQLRRMIHGVMNDPPEPGDYVQTFALGGTGDRFRVASVGTDQLGKFFYLTSGDRATGKADPHGIRVRLLPSIINDPARGAGVVKQGDIVDISGFIQKTREDGMMTTTEGEREIYAVQLETYPATYFGQPFAVPEPLGLINRSIGGSDFVVPTNTGSCLPGVFGAVGLNNVGASGKFWGKVTYLAADTAQASYPYFYIDDGSGVNDGSLANGIDPQVGVRVLLPAARAAALASLANKYVVVSGVVGAVSAKDLIPGSAAGNIRVIRAAEEPFTDLNSNNLYDAGETYDDWNQNGAYDGVIVAN